MTAFSDTMPCSLLKWTDVSGVSIAPIIREMAIQAAGISETSVYFTKTTQGFIPKGCHLHVRCRESLKCHMKTTCFLGCCAVYLIEIDRRFSGAYCLHHLYLVAWPHTD
jgi:hypothetical protein